MARHKTQPGFYPGKTWGKALMDCLGNVPPPAWSMESYKVEHGIHVLYKPSKQYFKI